jgi:uncharacterized protein (DUF2344 family)
VACQQEATPIQWESWIDAIKAKDEVWWEHTTKSGKTQLVNLRDRLFELELFELPKRPEHQEESTVILRYVGSCRHDGVLLRPEQILSMLEQVAGTDFHLLQIHRNRLILGV